MEAVTQCQGTVMVIFRTYKFRINFFFLVFFYLL